MAAALGLALEATVINLNLGERGEIAVYMSECHQGRPLVLLHSINAAPSAMEVKPLFSAFAPARPVYAPDLPGFGLSPRVRRRYDTEFFTQVIDDLLREITQRHAQAPDVIALSLTGEFVARAIVEQGALCNRLVLISPTGLSRRLPPQPKPAGRLKQLPGAALIGRSLYRLLSSPWSVRYFLNRAFTGSAPAELIDYALKTTKVEGAEYAPLAFLSMALFSPDALECLYKRLEVPTLLVYDTDPNIDFDRLPQLLTANPWVSTQQVVPTRGLPHWEKPQETQAAIGAFFDAG
jgi:pimeloyl-ACP methyl ester carboxylesterase